MEATQHEYDNLYRLKKLVNKKSSGEIISSYEYTTDNRGLRTKVVDNTGKITDYTYDNAGKLIKEVVTENEKVTLTASYSYDAVGNRLTKIENNITTNYSYDKNNRLLKEGNISYTYDNAGNLIKKQSTAEITEYAYNLDGKLSSVKKIEGSIVTNESYSYNAFGTRIKKVTNGEEERYLVDEYTSYSRVLEEKNKNNNLTATYTYGHELISQNRATSVSFYNRDGLGSITSLTNASQIVTDTYSYDAFGNLINSTGTTKNNYLFAGEEKDNTTGYYYLRARYMDTTTGRFTSMDSYLGSVDDPVSLHKYLYVNANPVNYIDPSGYEGTLAESEVVLYGMLTIASIMTFPVIDLSLLRNNNISIDYVNESVDLSKTVIWGIFEGTFSIANVNEQFINFVVHMAKSDKEQKKENSKDSKENSKNNESNKHKKIKPGKNFKDHFLRHKKLLEKVTGKKYKKFKTDSQEFLDDIGRIIDDKIVEYKGKGTINRDSEILEIYRGNGITVIIKEDGEWVTILEQGSGMDLNIIFTE